MTLIGVMAVILRYYTEDVRFKANYDINVVQISTFWQCRIYNEREREREFICHKITKYRYAGITENECVK